MRKRHVNLTEQRDEESSALLNDVAPTSITVTLDSSDPKEQVRNLFKRELNLKRTPSEEGEYEGKINITGPGAITPQEDEVVADHIVAIFVVSFDTKKGNCIEWSLPEDADLEGIEFKAMASGAHKLRRDFVYFKKDFYYGLACFENMPVESDAERGARMKSVGVLSYSYALLYKHMQFLEKQVRHQLQTPGRYSNLKAFYRDKRAILPSSASMSTMASSLSTMSFMSDTTISPSVSETNNLSNLPMYPSLKEELPEMKITHPAGSFQHFIRFFGSQIFVLWKYMLLHKRILFVSPPPIGMVCYRVYCCCCLGNHQVVSLDQRQPNPLFYVNVADIETLESEEWYVACTTERIFRTKPGLYDVYVDGQNVTSHVPALQELAAVSKADQDKLEKLQNQITEQQYAREMLRDPRTATTSAATAAALPPPLDQEEVFTAFFTEQNNRLFQTLLDVSQTQDRTLTSDHLRSMGLDPQGDRPFLMELVETYGIDVMLMVDNPCCPAYSQS